MCTCDDLLITPSFDTFLDLKKETLDITGVYNCTDLHRADSGVVPIFNCIVLRCEYIVQSIIATV